MHKIEFKTKDQWIEARKHCLTGTTVGKHIGIVSPYKPQTPEQMAKNPAVQFGVNCELSILTIFKNLPNIAKQTIVYPTIKPTLWYKDNEPRIAGSFDALAFENGINGFCECKSTSANLYDLNNGIIPDTTWLQIIHYFCLDDSLMFCYLVVCDYPKFGNGKATIEYKKILRSEIADRITNLKGWHTYLLNKGVLN